MSLLFFVATAIPKKRGLPFPSMTESLGARVRVAIGSGRSLVLGEDEWWLDPSYGLQDGYDAV